VAVPVPFCCPLTPAAIMPSWIAWRWHRGVPPHQALGLPEQYRSGRSAAVVAWGSVGSQSLGIRRCQWGHIQNISVAVCPRMRWILV